MGLWQTVLGLDKILDKKYYKFHLSGIISSYKFGYGKSRNPLILLENH